MKTWNVIVTDDVQNDLDNYVYYLFNKYVTQIKAMNYTKILYYTE